MLSKFEIIGISISVLCMAVALYLVRVETSLLTTAGDNSAQTASVSSGLVVVGEGESVNQERTNALVEASDERGNLKKLVIDDISVGTGAVVVEGDSLSIHYIGTLQNGYEFDNSWKKGTPFEFTVGDGEVIKGLEQGVLGMKVGGKRILVIPAELAYGNQVVGPIPANSVLVFAVELLAITN